MKSKFIVGSFFTKNTPYEEVFKKYLYKSCKTLSLEYMVIDVENLGSWHRNVAEKPRAILQILDILTANKDDRSLLFLDADATIEEYPRIFDELECDIAFHRLDWDSWYKNNTHIKELLSGTLYLKNNEKVRNLVNQWHEEAIKTTIWEQKILEKLIGENKELTIQELMIEYCYIKTLPNGSEPHVKVEHPIIIHHQASRTLKRIIK